MLHFFYSIIHKFNDRYLLGMFYLQRNIFHHNLLKILNNKFYPNLEEIHQKIFAHQLNTLNHNLQKIFVILQ